MYSGWRGVPAEVCTAGTRWEGDFVYIPGMCCGGEEFRGRYVQLEGRRRAFSCTYLVCAAAGEGFRGRYVQLECAGRAISCTYLVCTAAGAGFRRRYVQLEGAGRAISCTYLVCTAAGAAFPGRYVQLERAGRAISCTYLVCTAGWMAFPGEVCTAPGKASRRRYVPPRPGKTYNSISRTFSGRASFRRTVLSSDSR